MLGFGTKRDDTIIEKVLAGNAEQFGILVQRYLPTVQAIAYSRLSNPADVDDVAQETFLRAYQNLNQLRERRKFAAWLVSIARNMSSAFLRQRGRDALVKTAAEPAAHSVEPDFARMELSRAIREEVEKLDPEAREIVLLKYFAGKTSSEIASILEISDAAARKRLQRAREKLGERLLALFQDDTAAPRNTDAQAKRILGVVLATGASWGALDASATGTGALASGGAAGMAVSWKIAAGLSLAALLAASTFTALHFTSHDSPSSPPPIEVSGTSEVVPVIETNQTTIEAVPAAANAAPPPEPADAGPGVLVSGRILHSDGTPVAGAHVWGGYWGHEPRLPKVEATADEQGRYTLRLSKPWETFLIWAEKEGHVRIKQDTHSIPAEGSTGVDFILFREATLEGTVVNERGGGVPGVPVTGFNHDAGDILWTVSADADAQGVFRLKGMAPGAYSLAVVKEIDYDVGMEALRVEVKEGERLTGVRVPYAGEGLVIAGRVTDEDGIPLEGIMVQALHGMHPRDAHTQADGTYRITQLEPGVYPLMALDNKYQNEQQSVESGTEGVDFVLRRRGTVSGRVVDGETGEPLKSFEVYQMGGVASTVDSSNERWFDRVEDAEGRFTMENVVLDEATIIAKADGYMPAFEVVQLDSGQHLEGVTMKLSRGRILEGIVVDASGSPVEGASILLGPALYVPQGMNEDFLDAETAKAARARTQADGTFTLAGMAPGPQMLTAYHRDYAQGSITVDIPESGTPPQAHITLTSGGSIRGVVRVAGIPTEGISIMVLPAGGMGSPLAQIATGSDGVYRAEDITPGNVTIVATLQTRPEDMMGRRVEQTAAVQAGQETHVDFDLIAATGVLTGDLEIDVTQESSAVVRCTMPTEAGSEKRMTIAHDGKFRFEQMPEGEVEGVVMLTATSADSATTMQQVRMRPFNAVIEPGTETHVAVSFDGSESLEGRVSGGGAGEHVFVLALEGEVEVAKFTLASLEALSPLGRGQCRVGADGLYRLDDLQPGTYTILACAGTEASVEFRVASAKVTLGSGTTQTLDFDLR
ncbi:MAG: sigma-70 family RNA polymerase sigma factor [Candidatus Hydrogenedentes bacterium]|nr:sigma-70 family RNA polymerase sigma factor [Candidatus Hydrogenedentota bacterium]